MKKILLFSLAVLIISSCEKEIDVKDSETKPEFFIDFLASRTLEGWSAGVDNYYMHTNWEKDASDVVTFVGKMALEDCVENCNSIQFELRDFLPQSFGKIDFVDQFPTGTFPSANRASSSVNDAYLVTFKGHNNYKASDITWRFGDGLEAFNDSIVRHIYAPSNLTNDPIGILYNSFNEDGDDISNLYSLNLKDDVLCVGNFEIKQIEKDKLEIRMVAAGTTILGAAWKQTKADGKVLSNSTLDDDAWTISIGTKSKIFATAALKNGCTVDQQVVLNYDASSNSFSILESSFDIEVKRINNGKDLNLSTFAIQYIDANGLVYRSDLGIQHEERFFKITSKENYIENKDGENTIKLGVEFMVDVYLPNGEFITLRDGKGVIAVAEP